MHADIIKRKVLDLLDNPAVILPSVIVNNTKKVYLAGKSSKVPCKLTGLVKCNCKGFRYLSLFSHSVAISEKEGSLSLHIVNVKKKVRGKTVQDLLQVNRHLRKVLEEKISRKEEKEPMHTIVQRVTRSKSIY